MKMIRYHLLLALALACTRVCAAAPRYELKRQWQATPFSQPLDLQFVTTQGEQSAFVVQQSGQILRLRMPPDDPSPIITLDISSRIIADGEQGLLGLAVHPKFSDNGFIYVNYTRLSDGATVISRFTVARSTWVSDPASEVPILTVSQPFPNHNGGSLIFGADGFLYIALGDGGGAGDPLNNAQSLSSLLGKILRIDVDHPGTDTPYSIPPSNPFYEREDPIRAEIFARGLRNPFKITRDRASSRIWMGDVGQNAREEINILRRGANYGWNIVEGDLCYPEGAGCSRRGFQKPVWTIPHSRGRSVTGGYVYRGTIFERLRGNYIYGDFITGKIWRLWRRGKTYRNRLVLSSGLNISSFGQDSAGEIYVVDYSGAVFKLVKR
jgi:glucose/arabinose dehydrogenase